MRKALVLLAVLVVLSSCQMIPFQRKDTLQVPNVNIGTQGVEVSLAPNNPPSEIYEESAFTMLVTLSNLGTNDVEQGVFTVGYEPQYVYLPRQQAQGRYRLRGEAAFSPIGEERQFPFVFNTKPLGAQLERYATTLTFNNCYPYQTRAPLNVCIDTDLTGKKGKVCTPTVQSSPQGQGAPVIISSIEPRMLPHEDPLRIRPEFVLTINNAGSGEVTASSVYQRACSGQPLGDDGWNILEVNALLSDTVLACTPNPVKLKQTGTRVVCTLPEGIDTRLGTYTAPLTITVDYGYLTSVTTQVAIVKKSV